MQVILDLILQTLRGQDVQEVYPAFDAVPIRDKSKALFSVVTPESVQIEQPFPYGLNETVLKGYPFSAVYLISVLIPADEPLESAENFLYSVVVPRMESIGSVLCEVLPAHADAVKERVVLEGRFRLRGLYVEEGGDSA